MTHLDHAYALALKADEDIQALTVLRDNSEISDGIWGFHAQQAVEKLLKALLAYYQIRYPFIHQLEKLSDLLNDANHPLSVEFEALLVLTPYAAELRYTVLPEQRSPPRLERELLLENIRKLRKWVGRTIDSD